LPAKITSVAHALVQKGRFPVKAISNTRDVSRSNLYDVQGKKRGSYRKEEDDVLLPLIKEITDARETSGYPRVTVRLNRVLAKLGKPRVNRKRVYRIMKQNNLLLERHTARPERVHEGKIITLKSDMRWCSDIFEIGCWNSERVRFALRSRWTAAIAK
jgi:putative transposase